MRNACYGIALSFAVLGGTSAGAQDQSASPYPVADEVAARVIAKYQDSSCQQLAAQKQNPPSGEKAAVEQKVLQQLKQDPQMRAYFINKVAAPIANKLFECGMIP